MKKEISFKNKRKLTLRGYVFEPQKYDTAVMFLHGFPSSCEGFTASRIALELEKLGYLTLVFSFSHSPPSEGKFEDKLMSKEVEDIKYAIDFLFQHYEIKNLVLIGHSTGAIDASLYAHKDKRITKLILMGAESDTKHSVRYDFTDQQVQDFWTKGHIVYNSPGKWYHHKKLKKAFYDEFFTLEIPKAIKKFKRPLLIVHGEKDEAIPLSDPEKLFENANKPKKLIIIRGADHRFTNPIHFKKLLTVIENFIKN
ncbi:alpha/beta hydrolase [Candidatus Woesearchaeota archaeon]|nr:alpha/beta hydrolase [Candidatus Woesearchaeota archaeon]